MPGPWGEKASGGRRPGAVRKRRGARRMPEETAAVRERFQAGGKAGEEKRIRRGRFGKGGRRPQGRSPRGKTDVFRAS